MISYFSEIHVDCVNCLFFTNNKAVENLNFLGPGLRKKYNLSLTSGTKSQKSGSQPDRGPKKNNNLFQPVKYYKTVNLSTIQI